MFTVKELRRIYNFIESKEDRKVNLAVAALKTLKYSEWPRVAVVFETFKIERHTNEV